MRHRQIRAHAGVLIVVCLLGGAGILSGCGRRTTAGRQRAQGPALVTTQPVRVEPVEQYREEVGTLYGDEETTIAAKVSGRLVEIYKEVGDRVESGEKLCLIAPIDYELACKQKELMALEPLARLGLKKLPEGDFDVGTVPTVNKAKLVAENALATFKRLEDLRKENPESVTAQDYGDAMTAWKVAQGAYEVEKLSAESLLAQARTAAADLAVAKQRLTDTLICAPAPTPPNPGEAPKKRSYGVAERPAQIGEFLKEGSPVYRLVDDDPVKLRAKVVEKYIRDVRVGQAVLVESAASSRKFTGVIKRMNPQIDPLNRTFMIEAVIQNPDRELKAGAFVNVRILIGRNPKATFVPLRSIVTFAGTSKVFTVKDGKAVEHVIEQGETRGDWVQATSGIGPDDVVVTTGAGKLADGSPVSILREPPSESRPAEVSR